MYTQISIDQEVNETRMIMLPIVSISKIDMEFNKIVGNASKVIIRNIGKSIGLAVSELLNSGEMDVGEYVQEALLKMGLGPVEVKDHSENGEIVVRLLDPPSISSCNPCYFEEGVIKGLLEGLTKKKWRSKALSRNGACELLFEPF